MRVALPDGRRQIHLTGFMGSGKSTVGRQLARRLVWNFLDLDRVVERHEGRSVARIFAEDGEQQFRASERHVLRQVVAKPDTVVALGGGTLIDPGNVETVCGHATLVWLRCSLDVLEARCGGSDATRPLWGDPQALRKRYAERLPGYRAADIVIDAEADADSVADAVMAALTV